MNANPQSDVTEATIHAYVDGFLPSQRRRDVEGYLAANPRAAAKAEAYRKQNISLHGLYSSADDVIPETLSALAEEIDRALRARRSRKVGLYAIAAAAAVMLVVLSGLWGIERNIAVEDNQLVAFTRQAADAHATFFDIEAHDVATDAEQGLVPTGVPALDTLGLVLVAERVIPTEEGAAVQLVYRDEEGNRITLYMRANVKSGQAALTRIQQGDVTQLFWQNAGLAYSVIGPLNGPRLMSIAEIINAALGDVTVDQEDLPGELASEHEGDERKEAAEALPSLEDAPPAESCPDGQAAPAGCAEDQLQPEIEQGADPLESRRRRASAVQVG
ncbi:MAG: anti-sigma factor family protein [Alphaproteobacteria bacterium]